MFEYKYDTIDDLWIMLDKRNLVLSITRNKVLEYKEKYFKKDITELTVFKILASTVIVEKIDQCDNGFLVSSVIKYLFD